MRINTWTLQHFAFYKQLIWHLLSFNRTAVISDIKAYFSNTSMMSFLLLKRILHGYVLLKLRRDKKEKNEM
ncbi:MAG: hypothetical protein IJK53_10215 [Erysipelotrichaceae bacterium]|nr:hypothetical protein [Clostridia bacterium]MBQ6217743.1 hypothetical protein [Erysipelotrichaceae bacterium]